MNIKKSTITLIAVALISATAMPALASAKSYNFSFPGFEGNMMGWFMGNNGNNNFNNTLKDVRKAYDQAVRDANQAYNAARKTANDKLRSALKSAGFDFNKRLDAYRIYLSDLFAALKQKSAAMELALQKYIDALSGIQSNQAPTANNQTVTLQQNTTKVISLTGTDPEGKTLTFTVLTNPAHGTLSGTIPNLTYTPNSNFYGQDSFTFRVNDGTQNSSIATVAITVTQVNQAPTANAQNVTVTKNTSKTITLTGTDPQNSPLSFFVVTNPSHGTLSGTVPNLVYFPATDFTGTDSFTFKVNDGSLDSPVATVSITVNP
jgi:hypothetical protein